MQAVERPARDGLLARLRAALREDLVRLLEAEAERGLRGWLRRLVG